MLEHAGVFHIYEYTSLRRVYDCDSLLCSVLWIINMFIKGLWVNLCFFLLLFLEALDFWLLFSRESGKNSIYFTLLLHCIWMHYFFFGFFTDWTFEPFESLFLAFPSSKLIIDITIYSKKNAPDILNEFRICLHFRSKNKQIIFQESFVFTLFLNCTIYYNALYGWIIFFF